MAAPAVSSCPTPAFQPGSSGRQGQQGQEGEGQEGQRTSWQQPVAADERELYDTESEEEGHAWHNTGQDAKQGPAHYSDADDEEEEGAAPARR